MVPRIIIELNTAFNCAVFYFTIIAIKEDDCNGVF